MPFIIRQKSDPGIVYCGENEGWKQTVPPPPPDPLKDAQQFETQEEADKFIKIHNMDATSDAV